MDNVIYELAGLGIDVVLFGIFYKMYRKKANNVNAIKEAPKLEIDSNLKDTVAKSNGVVPYAVLTGVVKALSSPIRSQYDPAIKGVIQEKIVKEHKVRWSPVSRIWTTTENDLQKFTNNVPFVLTQSNGWRKSSIEVLDPVAAEELTLSNIYDQFVPHQEGLGGYVLGWVRGERSTGYQNIENMLIDGTFLTAIGEVVVDQDTVKLKPPANGLGYFLTNLSKDSLVKKLEGETKMLKIISVVFGCLGVSLCMWIAWNWHNQRKLKTQKIIAKQQYEEARRKRLSKQKRDASKVPKCVICLSNPVEAIVLDCGHACLCLDCSDQINDFCPICRRPIDRIMPTYLP